MKRRERKRLEKMEMEGEVMNGVGNERSTRKRIRSNGEMRYEESIEELSSEGKKTVMLVNKKRKRRVSKPYSSTMFDNTSSTYHWLRFGWIAEERRLPSGRLYRYFYDPKGQMYNTRQEVESIYENYGVVVIDD